VNEIHLLIKQDTDIVLACQKGRVLAEQLGFSSDDQIVIVIAISEVTRNIIRYAQQGEMTIRSTQQSDKQGVVIEVKDKGPGIADIALALQDGYSTGGGLGVGLPGVQRLMDELEIISAVGQGTTIIMRKWL
jgi:serine/threonine-protein kinase RsbT